MSKQWQIRRGTSAENDEFTGAQGELTMDTDKKQIRLHDGVTQGGIPFGDTVIEWQLPTAENNYTWYRKYRSGWVEQGGVEIASGTMITLPIAMANTKYTVQTTPTWGTADSSGTRGMCSFLKTTTSFKAQQDNNSGSFDWQVTGMAA